LFGEALASPLGVSVNKRLARLYVPEKYRSLLAENKVDTSVLIPLAKVDEAKARLLIEAGFDTVEAVAGATVKQLSDIKGIGKATAGAIIDSAKELSGGNDGGENDGAEGLDAELQEDPEGTEQGEA